MSTTMQPKLQTDQALLDVLAELKDCELNLHFPKPDDTQNDFEAKLANSFWEVGASGRCYSKEFVLECLAKRVIEQPSVEFDDFYCSQIEGNSYLLAYTQKEPGRITQRSAIWQRTDQGWLNLYHQGTVVNA